MRINRYSAVPFYINIFSNIVYSNNNSTLVDYDCDFKDSFTKNLIGYMDLGNRVVVPFLLMIICTSLLIDYIFQSRRKIHQKSKSNDNKKLIKDIKFAITSVALNVMFVLFNLPVSVIIFLPAYFLRMPYLICLFIFYAGYAANFYILFLTNSLFRNETFMLFSFKNTNNRFSPVSAMRNRTVQSKTRTEFQHAKVFK